MYVSNCKLRSKKILIAMVKVNLHRCYCVYFYFFLLVLVSRGAIELIIDKKMAFVVQALFIAILIIFSNFPRTIGFDLYRLRLYLLPFTIFLLVAFLSSVLTYFVRGSDAAFIYLLIILFLAVTHLLLASLRFNTFAGMNLDLVLVFLILLLVTVATSEQLFNFRMPGAAGYFSIIRPASMTGSKQHYSIILSIVTLFIVQYRIVFGFRKYDIPIAIGVVGVFSSLTRSGVLILALSFLIYSFFIFLSGFWSLKKTIVCILILTTLSSFVFVFSDEVVFIERALSLIDTSSAGNDERIDSWVHGSELLTTLGLLVGEYTGIVTNATRTIDAGQSFVVESSPLQLMLNFGIIGCCSFYAIFFLTFKFISRELLFLKSSFLASIISTVVYQSMEVIPFVILLALFPIVSQHITFKKMNL